MTELGVGMIRASPDSDCNSNLRGSFLSTASSQDVDFVQDNSDYQWFLDYGYRDGGTNHHTSILSIPETYEAGDNYYDALAKNMDANLAEADMESFRTEDIHALLTNLPPMCTDHLSQETNRHGESFAEVSGSMMGKFDLDSFISPHSSSQGEDSTSMSICKSELLFSPVKETPMPGANFSVDSLDCDLQDMMLTCQANKDNYTIAFEGSVTMYSEDSEYQTDKSSSNPSNQSGSLNLMPKANKNLGNLVLKGSMTQSDSSSFTTWSKLKKRISDDQLRKSSGNNNNSEHESMINNEFVLKSRSLPNLHKQKLEKKELKDDNSTNSSNDTTIKPVKVFDIQHSSSSSAASQMATSIDASSCDSNKPANLNLVKLFMKQKSSSQEGMSLTMDQLSSTEWPKSGENSREDEIGTINLASAPNPHDSLKKHRKIKSLTCNLRLKTNHLDRSIQTSQFSEVLNLKNTIPPSQSTSSVKLIAPSFLNTLKKQGEIQKPVYILYPNYVLPDLEFLNEKNNVDEMLFVPQKAPKVANFSRKRPFSFNDIEMLKKKGFAHVKDWDSLNVLLPQEYRKVLADVPELASCVKVGGRDRPSFIRTKRRPLSCELMQNNISSSGSTATQPSSGYRGSSSMLTDSQNSPAVQGHHNPLFVYRYDSVTSSEASLMNSDKQAQCITTTPHCPVKCVSQDNIPPRPPLPRGILRKGDLNRRYSMYETSEEDLASEEVAKRKSVPEPYFLNRNKRHSETEDEGVDAGTSSSSIDEKEVNRDYLLPQMSTDELIQLEEFLKLSGISSSDDERSEESLTQLRSYVGKFLALKINQDHFGDKKSVSFKQPTNSPNVSAFILQRFQPKTVTDMTICEENENSPNYSSPVHSTKPSSDNLLQKRSLIQGVLDGVEQVMQHFTAASNQQELTVLGDSNINPACAKLVLTMLCPALYAVLSDGLKPCLETSFGPITNSVWQVVEAAAQQGPLTKALNDLVMKINSEDVISEGLVKFNAFIFGLLNVRSLDAWLSYLRTRESVLKKHYTADSLFVLSQTGGLKLRGMLDSMVAALQPLAFIPFQLDLLFEYKQLHDSFKRMDSFNQPCEAKLRERPRSCVEVKFKLGEDVNVMAKKRWSGIDTNSKFFEVYDRLANEDEYADSLETQKPSESEENPINERRFRKLQQRWEMLSNNNSPPTSPTHKSKIPRPITSPVRPSGIPVLVSPTAKTGKLKGAVEKKGGPRTSRVDQIESNHVQRPSSLPYKPAQCKGSKVVPQRRAASSSLSRRPVGGKTPKTVRTVNHRLPSESGHLSYNKGEVLKVVLEVDDKWLLCCRGGQKGLVPRSAVIADKEMKFS